MRFLSGLEELPTHPVVVEVCQAPLEATQWIRTYGVCSWTELVLTVTLHLAGRAFSLSEPQLLH